MKEATKTRQLFGELEKRIFCGNGIDIGCGDDPITPDAKRFDTDDGDANLISQYVSQILFIMFFRPIVLNIWSAPLRRCKSGGSL